MVSKFLISSLLIFGIYFILDFVWAKYTLALLAKKAVYAGLWSGSLVLLGGVGVLIYKDEPLYLIPATLGAVLGTIFAIKRPVAQSGQSNMLIT